MKIFALFKKKKLLTIWFQIQLAFCLYPLVFSWTFPLRCWFSLYFFSTMVPSPYIKEILVLLNIISRFLFFLPRNSINICFPDLFTIETYLRVRKFIIEKLSARNNTFFLNIDFPKELWKFGCILKNLEHYVRYFLQTFTILLFYS